MTARDERRDPEEIERDIGDTRAEIADTLGTIERRLAPERLVDQALDYLRRGDTGTRLGEVIKRNPLPVALVGVGLAWLAFTAWSDRRPAYPRGYPTTGREPRRVSPLVGRSAVAAGSREHLVAWLRDAHAMELQSIELLEKQAGRLEHYPELLAKVRAHLAQSHSQAQRVERCLARLGAGPSGAKDLAGKMVGATQQLSGLFAGDEVVKSALADHTFEHYEMASYRVLIAAAEEAGEPEVARICEEILHEEEAMADWLAGHLPELTRRYLDRDAAGEPAKT
jgi:ferritin-like metal-binding protein YciE